MDRTIPGRSSSVEGSRGAKTLRVCPSCLRPIDTDARICLACEHSGSHSIPSVGTPREGNPAGEPQPTGGGSAPRSLTARYEILDLLGQGGMGIVYKARDRRLDREVALKLLISPDADLVALFEREAKTLASFEHDHIVRIYDFGRADDVPYLTMECVRGCSLATRLAEKRLTLVESVRTCIDILKGVAEAHRRGIVHRDLKPANVFIDESGRVKVADFGMALRIVIDGHEEPGTKSDAIVGTPGYMAPEVRSGNPAAPPNDVYAVGVILYEMLAGQRLDDVTDLTSYLYAPPSLPSPPSTVNPSIPRGLDAIVLRAVDPDPAARPDAPSLMAMLVEWLQQSHRPIRGPESLGLPPHPYKFLSHYGSGDRQIFFGRDAEISELLEIIENSPVRLLFVFGPCGIGKSSLIQAGVIPALDSTRFDPVTLISGQDPSRTILDGMASRLQAASIQIPDRGVSIARMLEASPRMLVDLVQSWGRTTNKTMVVFCDQLEELFTHNLRGSSNVADFFRIVEIVVGTQTVPVKLVLSFRTEFRGALYLLEEKLRRHQRSVAVREIGHSGLIEVIEGPSRLASYGFRYQEGFSSHLAGEVLRSTCGAGVAVLPVLQIVCRQLYDQMKKSAADTIGWDLYKHALGGVNQALTRYVEERLEAPSYAHHGAIARQILKALTVKEGGERFARARDEEELLGFPDRKAAETTLEQLISDHLVVREEISDVGRRVRLSSEVICRLVDGWTIETGDLDRAARTLSKAFRNWSEGEHGSEDLLEGSALTVVEEHLVAMNGLTEPEHRFVAASVARRNRRRIVAATLAVLVMGVVGCLVYVAYLKPGIVELDSEPRKASIHWGDTYLGETPLSWKTRPAMYSLRLSRNGYDPTRIDVRVPAGGTVGYRPVLRYPFGILAVASLPSEVECEVWSKNGPSPRKAGPRSGKPLLVRKTPFTTELRAGTYVLRAVQAGYVTTTTPPFTVGANRELCHVNVSLTKDVGSLFVWAPFQGEVAVRKEDSGERVRKAPVPMSAPLELPTGRYRIECRSNLTGNPYAATITISRDARTPHTVWFDQPYPLWRGQVGCGVATNPALSDFDGDGILDVVAGLSNQNVVALSGKTGQRLWSYETRGPINSSPALGDLDRDGVADVVIGSDDSRLHAISGKRGLPLWTFQTGAAVVSSPAVADLDKDGVPDAVVGSGDHMVYAVSGRTGRPLWKYATAGDVVSSPALFDLDKDGTPDAVVGSDDRKVHAISGSKGTPLFTVETRGAVRSSAVVADLESDGIPEIVIGSRDRSIHVIDGAKGKTTWKFETGGEVDSSPALGDFDQDGCLDVVAGSGDGCVYVVSGRKRTALRAFRTEEKAFGSPMVGDVTADGVDDVVIGTDNALIYVFDGRSGKRLHVFSEGPHSASAVALGDLSGDGVLDLVAGSRERPFLTADSIVPQRARWSAGLDEFVFIQPAATDLDSDGFPDIVATSHAGYAVGVSGRTGRTLWELKLGRQVTADPALVDLDRDGIRDVVFSTQDARAFAVSGKTGRTLRTYRLRSPASGEVVAADLDGDSLPDLAFGTRDGWVQTFSGTSVRELASYPVTPRGRVLPALADLDGDGRADVVAASTDGTVLAISTRTGKPIWKFSASGELSRPPVLADVDGDGVSDAAFNCSDGRVYVLSGRTGQPLWIRAHGARGWGAPAVADLDGDGRPDVVTASGELSVVALSGKNGSPLWTCRLDAPPTAVMLAHVDDDGVPDLVTVTAANQESSNLNLISGRTGQRLSLVHCPGGTTESVPLLLDPSEPWIDRAVTWRTGHQGPPSTLNRKGPRRFLAVGIYIGYVLMANDVVWPPASRGAPKPVGFTQGRSAARSGQSH